MGQHVLYGSLSPQRLQLTGIPSVKVGKVGDVIDQERLHFLRQNLQ